MIEFINHGFHFNFVVIFFMINDENTLGMT